MSKNYLVLIVEDDAFKMQSLTDQVEECLPNAKIEKYISVAESVLKLSIKHFDFILLDMALPARELKVGKGPTDSLLSGGLEILLELSYYKRNEKVVIVTQYPEIEIDGELINLSNAATILKNEYFSGVLACIYYEHGKEAWKEQLQKVLRKYENSNH